MSRHDDDNDFVSITDQLIRDRIVHVLTVYPNISHSMLQIGLGPALSPKMWRPVLSQLYHQGRIKERLTVCKGPTGRDQEYRHLYLVPVDDMVPVIKRDILKVASV